MKNHITLSALVIYLVLQISFVTCGYNAIRQPWLTLEKVRMPSAVSNNVAHAQFFAMILVLPEGSSRAHCSEWRRLLTEI